MCDEVKYSYLKNHPLFSNLSEDRIKNLCQFIKIKTAYRGETVSYGDSGYSKIYFLVKGKVKIVDTDVSGNDLIKDILMDGDIFGDLTLEGNPSVDECAEALTVNTTAFFFNIAEFKKALEDNPSLSLNYTRKVSSKLKKLETRHADLVFRDAKSRFLRFIKNWAQVDGSRMGNKIILNNYLTHSDIASVISTSRQSVNVLFNELRDSGMLFYNRQRIELNDPVNWN
jgi:CRP/FNR family transcriptional regulator, cyclic AMP receptor protein